MVAPDITVRDDRAASAFQATIGPQVVGTIEYERDGGIVTIKHTTVELELQGQGIATAFVQQTLDQLRSEGVTVRNECDFVSAFLGDHPEYASVVDSATPGESPAAAE